jgi:hypothetical protein
MEGQAGLADARSSFDENELRHAVLRPTPAVLQQFDRFAASHERTGAGAGREAEGRCRSAVVDGGSGRVPA